MGFKFSRIGKIIGLFLLIIFTLQVTDLACIGEDRFVNATNTAGVHGENQLIKADLDEGNNINPTADILAQCQCPCHLGFMETPFAEVTSYQSISLSSFPAVDLSLKKISTDIFQPPKLLI